MRIHKTIRIRQYDTLRLIAARELGDQSRWSELATLNDLRTPYIVSSFSEDDRQPHTRIWNDLLTLPILVESDSTWRDESQETRYTNLYGTDIELIDGAFVVEAGKIKTVAGVENLKQALVNRLTCVRGEYFVHPTYGSNISEIIGLKNSKASALLGAAYIKQSTEEEPRVVPNVKVAADIVGDEVRYRVLAHAQMSNDPIDLNLSIPIS